MHRLRKTWARTFNKAMALLRSKNNPIARYTVKLIDTKKINVLPIALMKHHDYLSLRSEYNDANEVKLPTSLPLARKTIEIIENDWDGFIYGNRIYISDIKDPQHFARILVHETNHFINDSNSHYETEEDRFREECRANVAEVLVFGNQTRNYLTQIAKKVSKNYHVPMPKEPNKMPKGIFYR